MKMKEINIGVKFEDERTGKVCTVVEKNSKYKTLLLEPEGENAFSTSLATFNKYFTEVADLDDLSTPPTEEETEPEIDETKDIVDDFNVEDGVTTWNSKKRFTWKEILDVFIEKADKKRKVATDDVPKATKRVPAATKKQELFSMLPFETILTSYGKVAVEIGNKMLLRVVRNEETGKSMIVSDYLELDSIEYDASNSEELGTLIDKLISVVNMVA